MRYQLVIPVTLFSVLLIWGCDGSEKQRPDVQFDHAAHEKALEGKCEPCHQAGEQGFVPSFKDTEQLEDKDARAELFHNACMGCHKKDAAAGKEAGPRTCAGCHRRRPPAKSSWKALRFDSSLHARHVVATGGEKECKTCHEEKKPEGKLHGPKDKIHGKCISCHLDHKGAGDATGPVNCAGCHDGTEQSKHEKLASPPRLMAEQKDHFWIQTKGARAKPVAFNHKTHEAAAPFCTSCHHENVQACGKCHASSSNKPTKEGGFVSLEDASHNPGSRHSCVGCHQKTATASSKCKGCHLQLPVTRVGKECNTCHTGTTKDAPLPDAVVAAALPPTSDDFPATVKIGGLANKYAPSDFDCAPLRRQNLTSAPDTAGCTSPTMFPHRKVVAALFKGANASALARAFHGDAATLCAGCHHEPGASGKERTGTPPCKSCHGPKAHPSKDQPGLTAAYHRQCLGCHQKMGLKQTGCTDCHAKKEEVSR